MVDAMAENMTKMSNHAENYCTTKDLGKAFAVLVFMIAGVPILAMMATVGPEEYFGRYCKATPLAPCFFMAPE